MISLSNSIEKFQSSKKSLLGACIVLFIILAFVQIRSQFFFSSQQKKATVINYAGRQRMISQRLAKMAYSLQVSGKDSIQVIHEMKELEANWTKIHHALRYGSDKLGILCVQNPRIDSLFKAIQPHKDSISDAIASLRIQEAGIHHNLNKLNVIQRHENQFLLGMDQLVKEYELDSQQNISTVRVVAFFAGLSLLSIFIFIFIPAFKLLSRQNSQIQEALNYQEALNNELLSSESELKRTREFLEQTNQIAQVGGWDVDLLKNKVYWTEITRDIHEVDNDYTPDFNKSIAFYKEGYSRDTMVKIYEQAVTEGECFDEALQIMTGKGKPKWVRVMGIPEFKNGICVRVYGTFQDIDKQRKNEAHLRLLKSVITNVKDAIVVTEIENDCATGSEIVYVNKAFCKMTGYDEEDVLGKTPQFLQGPESDIEEIIRIRKAISNWHPFEAEIINYKKNGDQFWNSLSALPLADKDGRFTHWIAVERDISQQKINEQNLIDAKAQAESASLAKSEFLANMSHEIRTPLNGVIGFSDLLMKTHLNESQQQYMQAIHTSANALLDLINDILDFSKIEAGKLELSYERTNLTDLLDQVVDIVKYKVKEKDIELLLSTDPKLPLYVHIDPVRLRQILINLISNAVKFTEEGEIEVSVQCVSDENEDGVTQIQFFVRDTGIGIAPDRQQAIFSAFSQEDASITRKYGGTGLGLSISNQLLRMMDSQLSLESSQGVGSKFSFTLSVKTENEDKFTFEAIPIKHALIVDDHHRNCQIIQDILSLNDITSDIAYNGIAALQQIERRVYDVMIIDLTMPFMNGLQVIREVRENMKIDAKKLPIVLLHSSAEDSLINEQRKVLDIQRVISKPITIKQLSETLKNIHVVTAPQEVAEVENTKPSERSLTLLLVDDNPLNRKLAISMLSQIFSYATIHEATDGLEAVEAFKRTHAELILMDVQMPNMSGYEASTEIRKLPEGKNTTIIALTAATVKGEKERCLAAGMDDYLSKPILLNTLKEKLSPWSNDSIPTVKSTETKKPEINIHFDLNKCKSNLSIEDMSTIEQFVQVLFQQLDQDIPLLNKAFLEQDLTNLRNTAHKHKSSTSMVSMQVLSGFFQSLENQKEFQESMIESLIQQIEQEYEQVKSLVAQSMNIQKADA